MNTSTNQVPNPESGIVVYEGDLFKNAPRRCVLVHACNTLGSWGAGIATIFKRKYPAAYEVYRDECVEKGSSLLGTCLLIPAGDRDIACLFTSRKYGRQTDPKDMILRSTRSAVQDLLRQLEGSNKPIYGCRINAGAFRVPWEETVEILDELGLRMTVYEIAP
ncbi:SubName: Full=Related to POA1-Phosphatase of ADP-ribose 1-phosphate, role in regulation of tRNA splicing {ECO:0000313/EMBL:CCA70814.1} [Serendipita indica DSM 11827]|uniref:ADP-ribose 1''-phosphate phosphatase n=1 Tax=Serendipita indica (strain DSM 11827) TaxID=1109443 RepID=G4THL9_SERID|nr:SubName: Full=Related to POA1-Phosphatase of ADP-ribose 1-phosphate, role in regulation of tRNA splicing {ECO:0000313/EMBL:CCA70814.1} [Serendipita indica DSM 11827]CCA70814.1 related to POA1-Phosphatase of ADP-ribose 1-phosphate, role in regulation of tRNA splicing [Serendipita indica DSM 11827]